MANIENEFVDSMSELQGEGREKAVEGMKKYLTFISDGLYFAVDAGNVVEILTSHTVTHLPKVPEFVAGIINLRGQTIPVIDARLRMNRPAGEYTDQSCIIVIDVNSIMMGLYVDGVSHVVDIMESEIQPTPTNNSQEFVNGIIRVGEMTSLILDCEKLVQ